jgi:hypothetical protein
VLLTVRYNKKAVDLSIPFFYETISPGRYIELGEDKIEFKQKAQLKIRALLN